MQSLMYNGINPAFGMKTNMHHFAMSNNKFKPSLMVVKARQTMLENNMEETIVLGRTRGFHEVFKLKNEIALKGKSGKKINSDYFRRDDESTQHSVVKILIGEKRDDSGKTLSPMHFDLYEKIIFNPDEKEKLVVNGVPRPRPKKTTSKLGRLWSRSSSRKVSSDGEEEPKQQKIA